jgi:hypothetical protein
MLSLPGGVLSGSQMVSSFARRKYATLRATARTREGQKALLRLLRRAGRYVVRRHAGVVEPSSSEPIDVPSLTPVRERNGPVR